MALHYFPQRRLENPRRRGKLLAVLATLSAVLSGVAVAAPPEDATAEAALAFSKALEAEQAGQWTQAELYFERSLMYNPDDADARFRLALLLAQRGRNDAARALIESLIEDPRTPEAHRQRLIAMLARPQPIVPRPPAAPVRQTQAEITFGYTLNPYARANVSELTLTLPEGDITLPLAQQAHSAPLLGLSLRHVVQDSWGFDVTTQSVGGGDPYQTAGRVLFFGDTAVSGQPLRWSLYSLRAIDGSIRHAAGASALRKDWRFSAGLFSEPDLDRRGYTLRVDRSLMARPGLEAVGFAELEQATHGRSGYVRGGVLGEWLVDRHWLVSAQLSLHRDLEGYSPLLANDASRRMTTANLAVERGWEPMPKWRLVARAHVAKRWSNISLFEYRDAGFQFSLQRWWP